MIPLPCSDDKAKRGENLWDIGLIFWDLILAFTIFLAKRRGESTQLSSAAESRSKRNSG
jgi:hypothetical protein